MSRHFSTVLLASHWYKATCKYSRCSGLTSVKIPNSVKWIESYAFANCKGLTTLTIPNSVTRIVYNAFSSCSDLTDVYCYIKNLSNVDVDLSVFENSYLEYTTLHVPYASLEAYKKKEPWNGFGKIVPLERPVGNDWIHGASYLYSWP